jgi:hypothetical protein
MPEEIQSTPPSISPPLEKPKRNWKKVGLILVLALVVVILVGIGLYLLIPRITEEPPSTTKKIASPSAQRQPADKKGVLYIKTTGEVNKPLPIPLGNIVVHNLADSKEISLTKDGKAGRFKVSPGRTKILFVRYLDEQHSLWTFDLKTKKEEKLSEINEAVSEKEYATIDTLFWRADNEAVAYLVNNRPTDDDPRAIKKTTLYVVSLADKTTKIVNLPLGFGAPGILAWVGDEIYYANSTDDGGLQTITSINLVDKSTKDESNLINKKNIYGLPEASGSPSSRKFFVASSKVKLVEIPSKKETLLSSSKKEWTAFGSAWTFDGNGVIISSKEGDKLKITLRQLDKNKMKFALFPFSEKQPYLQILGAFSDNNNLVGYKSSETGYSYWLISLDEASEKTFLSSNEFINLVPIETF